MDVAIDLSARKLVRAAAAPRGRNYRCPTCRAPVHLRKGTHREAHFAHDPGQGKPECDEYHASDNWLGLVWGEPAFTPPAEILPQQRLTLWLNVQPQSGLSPAAWSLEVLVPRSPGRAGRLTFDGGADGLRVELSCAKLNAGGISCRVDLDAASFRASWVSRDVDRMFAQAVQDRIVGLDPERANVFAADRGSRQERASALNWGGSYYLVYRMDRLADVPPGIATVRLSNQKTWSCMLVTLPSVADPDVNVWFDHNTSVSILPAKQQWGIPAPALHAMDSSARVVINAGTEVVLAVHPGNRGGAEPTLQGTAGEQTAGVTLRPDSWNFVQASGVVPTHPLALRVNDRALPEMVVRSFALTSPKVVLQFGTDTVEAHTSEARVRLDRVRAGLLDLTGIILPLALVAQLRFRRLGEVDWTPVVLTASGSSHQNAFAAQDLTEWLAILRDRHCDVVIDFGPFGYWWSDGQAASVAPRIAMSAATRAHLAWVLQAAGRPAAAIGADESLASAIGSLMPPRWLTAHHRLARSRIGREGGKR